MENFRYLGSVFDATGGCEQNVKATISAAWKSGVNCQECCVTMPIAVKGKVYKTVVRSAVIYGEEVKRGFLKEMK